MPNAKLLELSAIAPEREKVLLRTPENPEGLRPDGAEYELTAPEDLSTLQLQELVRSGREVQELLSLEAPSAAQNAKLDQLMNEQALKLVQGATLEDVARLPGIIKQKLILRFLGLTTEALQTPLITKGSAG